MNILEYTKSYTNRILKNKIEEIFFEKHLEDNEVSLDDIICEYLDEHISDIISDVTDGVEVEITEEVIWETCYTELTKISIEEIMEAIENPYHGLSPRERNNSLK